ncbi:MAG TPA: TfoX/Sxy family protein [Blastocatellia bacterium]|nr:TfoX/Sxy family protein [Blastocatellia bacterium]
MSFDDGLARRVRSTLHGTGTIVERRMFGGLAFMVNGHMCCGIVGDKLVVRVGAENHGPALADPNSRPMDFNGKPMKGFVYVNPAGYGSAAALKRWVNRGLKFVLALPPKQKN